MSTSDPDRPADDATAPAAGSTPPTDAVPTTPDEPVVAAPATPDEGTATADGAAAAAPDEPPAAAPSAAEPTGVEPAVVEPAVVEPAVVEPAVVEPAVVEPVATAEAVSLDTGRHAVVRPVPVPPEEPAPAPVTTPVAAPAVPVDTPPTATPVDPAIAAVAAASVATPPVDPVEPGGAYGPITPEPDVDGRLFPDPNAPSSPSAGSRILGIIVGLVLAPIAVGVLLLGESQILEAQVDGWDATTSVFGIVLVTLGLLLLGCVLLLGIWTAAVPITGGALLTAAGAFYLYTPSIAREQTLHILTSSGWRLTVTEVTVAATSGMVIAVGFLLLLAGLVIASARRRGVHLGEFRERHRA